MKLYIFKTSNWSRPPKLKVEEFEVEEKPKTYVCKGRRFNKEDIGRVTGYDFSECILLENNPSKACKILLKRKELELKWAEEKVADKRAEIENLKRYIRNESEGKDNE